MLRAILVLLLLAVLAGIALVWTGIVDVTQTQQAQPPGVSGGQAPKFDVKVNPPQVGTTTTNVQVPVVEMKTKQIEVPAIRTGGDEAGGNQQ